MSLASDASETLLWTELASPVLWPTHTELLVDSAAASAVNHCICALGLHIEVTYIAVVGEVLELEPFVTRKATKTTKATAPTALTRMIGTLPLGWLLPSVALWQGGSTSCSGFLLNEQ